MAILLEILGKHQLQQGELHKFIILGKPDRDLSCKEDKKIVLAIPSLLPCCGTCISPQRGLTPAKGRGFSSIPGGIPIPSLQQNLSLAWLVQSGRALTARLDPTDWFYPMVCSWESQNPHRQNPLQAPEPLSEQGGHSKPRALHPLCTFWGLPWRTEHLLRKEIQGLLSSRRVMEEWDLQEQLVALLYPART